MNKDIEINNKFYQKTIHGGKCGSANVTGQTWTIRIFIQNRSQINARQDK